MKNKIVAHSTIMLLSIIFFFQAHGQTWTQIGPTKIPDIGNAGNGFGQFICVTLHPAWVEKTSTDIVFASQRGGGLWKRTYDQVTLKYTWNPKNMGLPAISIVDRIKVNPNDLIRL